MIKEHELTKEIIESGIRSIRSKGTETGIIIEFNNKTELVVDAVAHSLSAPRDLKEMWKEEVYPHLIKFLARRSLIHRCHCDMIKRMIPLIIILIAKTRVQL